LLRNKTIESCESGGEVKLETSLFQSMPFVANTIHFNRTKENAFYHPLHYHEDCCEFLLIVEGEGDFVVDGKHYTASSGSLMCYNRSIWHGEKSTSDTFEAMYIGFRGLQIKNFPDDHFLAAEQPALIDLGEQFVPIKQLFGDILAEHKNTAPESVTIANHLLGVLMCRLSQHVHYEKNVQHIKRPSVVAVQSGKRYIELNYRADINLEALAKLTHVNAYHFCHLFKQETGMSPIQYLIRYRVEVAKQYLSTTDLSISEISELVGYKSDTYFQNIFKKMMGMPPGRYRSQARKLPRTP
jgi:AraC-like DNA-binding protein